jgi:hypothetical protein
LASLQRSAMAVCGRTRKHLRAQGGHDREIAGVQAASKNAGAAVALVGPGFVVADGADGGEEVHVTHDFGINDGWDFVDGDFVALAVEANLIGADEDVDSGAGLFGDRGSSQRGGAVWREIDVKLSVHVPVVEILAGDVGAVEAGAHQLVAPAASAAKAGELVLAK